jgi:hypothetical protein
MKTTKLAIWSLAALLAVGFAACNKDDIELSNPRITLTTAKNVGKKISLYIDADDADKAGVWIDLNNNGIKENNEAVTGFNNEEVQIKYLLGAQTITIYGKVTKLECGDAEVVDGNQLTALDVSKNTALIWLECNENQLKALDVSKNSALAYLSCDDNQLTALNVSKNSALTELHCGNNQLTALDVSKSKALNILNCQNNQLTELNVSKNTGLWTLYCGNNQLKALDLSKNTKLNYLHCYNNQLKALDLSKNTKLMKLDCSGNQLTALNVSKNTKLEYLCCYNNKISDKMEALVKSLPNRPVDNKGDFYVIKTGTGENNKCTQEQVTIATSKNWNVRYSNGQPYTGS